MTTIVDTGPLVAAADRSDKPHATCARLLAHLIEQRERLVVPMPVAVEVCWLLEKYQGPTAEASFLDLLSRGVYELGSLPRSDVARVAALVRQYADFPLGMVDAAVVAIAERLGVQQVATLDRRHFTAVRPEHVTAFRLIPE